MCVLFVFTIFLCLSHLIFLLCPLVTSHHLHPRRHRSGILCRMLFPCCQAVQGLLLPGRLPSLPVLLADLVAPLRALALPFVLHHLAAAEEQLRADGDLLIPNLCGVETAERWEALRRASTRVVHSLRTIANVWGRSLPRRTLRALVGPLLQVRSCTFSSASPASVACF